MLEAAPGSLQGPVRSALESRARAGQTWTLRRRHSTFFLLTIKIAQHVSSNMLLNACHASGSDTTHFTTPRYAHRADTRAIIPHSRAATHCTQLYRRGIIVGKLCRHNLPRTTSTRHLQRAIDPATSCVLTNASDVTDTRFNSCLSAPVNKPNSRLVMGTWHRNLSSVYNRRPHLLHRSNWHCTNIPVALA